jgi:hypothetical protein
LITIFSAPKPFNNEQIATIQFNAIQSWLNLGSGVEVLLMGNEPGLDEAAERMGVSLLSVHSRAPSGAPLVSELFRLARDAAQHAVLGYVNADIMLLDDFLPTVKSVADQFERFLLVGNRHDIDISEEMAFNDGWVDSLRRELENRARQHKPMGSDYFVFPKGQFTDIPEFVLGRAGWDNWMIYKGRYEQMPVIDASKAITAVHQNHDYSHLPGGVPHYRHPESMKNIQLAGGYESMFRLRDADWLFTAQGMREKSTVDWEWPRKIEADLIASFGTGFKARLTRMLFHPGDAAAYLREKFFGPDQPAQAGEEDIGSVN